MKVTVIGRRRFGSALGQGDVLRVGACRVVRGAAPPSLFGAIADDEDTQVDGVPVPVGPCDSPDFVETTPIRVVSMAEIVGWV